MKPPAPTEPCPVCGDADPLVQETLNAATLAASFRRRLGVSLAAAPTGLISLLRCGACDLAWFFPRWAGDGTFYDELQRSEHYYLAAKAEYVAFAASVSASASILDVGAGVGALAALLPPGTRFVGLGLSEGAVREAGRLGRDVRLGDVADHAQTHPGAYDHVCAFQVLEHVIDPLGFMRSCAACLAPGGRLVISVPNDSSYVGRGLNTLLNIPPHHISRWNANALHRLGEYAGLRLCSAIPEPLESPNIASCANARLRHCWLEFFHRYVDGCSFHSSSDRWPRFRASSFRCPSVSP